MASQWTVLFSTCFFYFDLSVRLDETVIIAYNTSIVKSEMARCLVKAASRPLQLEMSSCSEWFAIPSTTCNTQLWSALEKAHASCKAMPYTIPHVSQWGGVISLGKLMPCNRISCIWQFCQLSDSMQHHELEDFESRNCLCLPAARYQLRQILKRRSWM